MFSSAHHSSHTSHLEGELLFFYLPCTAEIWNHTDNMVQNPNKTLLIFYDKDHNTGFTKEPMSLLTQVDHKLDT